MTDDLSSSAAAVRAAESSLSTAATYAEELLAATVALQLESLSVRLSELLGHISELTERAALVQRSVQAAIAAASALATGSSRPSPGPPRPALRRVRGPVERLLRKERSIVDYLTERGAEVEVLPEDHSQDRVSHPDALVHRAGERSPVLTEFKTLDAPTSTAVKGDIRTAARQLAQHGGGDVVIDGRKAGLDEATARHGYARAKGEARAHDRPMPRRTFIIVGDGRQITFSEDDPA